MSRIRGRDTSPEVQLRSAVWRLGLRYRVNQRVAGIRPDLIFPRSRLAIFVDGCFWHGCPEHYVRPRSSTADFWASKLMQNTARDERQLKHLQNEGWRVVRVWEHEVRHSPTATALLVREAMLGNLDNPSERWVVTAAKPSEVAGYETWTLRDLLTGRVRRVSHWRGDGVNRRKTDKLADRLL